MNEERFVIDMLPMLYFVQHIVEFVKISDSESTFDTFHFHNSTMNLKGAK